jgi:hypothetical protein
MEERMMVCDYSGSYYDSAPWTEKACSADEAVPAGCPVHFVIGTELDVSSISAAKVAMNGTTTPVASTATRLDAILKTFTLPDEFSCDCTPTATGVQFSRYEVAVPSAQPGDAIEISAIAFGGSPLYYTVTAAGPCPDPAWPTEYHVALACDRCPDPPDGSDGSDGSDGEHASTTPGGCAAGGDPSLALLAVLGALPLLGSRRRR